MAIAVRKKGLHFSRRKAQTNHQKHRTIRKSVYIYTRSAPFFKYPIRGAGVYTPAAYKIYPALASDWAPGRTIRRFQKRDASKRLFCELYLVSVVDASFGRTETVIKSVSTPIFCITNF